MTVPFLLVFLLAPSLSSDSLPTLKKCGPPIAPVGIVRLESTVAFEVSAKGEASLDGLSVLEAKGASAPEVHSVLERYLPACRFKPGKQSPFSRIRMTVAIENGVIRWGPIMAALPGDSVDAAGLPAAAILGPADTLAFTDPRLEERPAALQCSEKPVARDEVVQKYRIDGQMSDAPPPGVLAPPPATRPQRTVGVEVLLHYTVLSDGRVVPSDVTVVEAPSPAYADLARAKVSGCKWVPGRVAGIAVPVRIASRERI